MSESDQADPVNAERIARAKLRLDAAHRLLAHLDLPARWSRYGNPVLCGATAYDLIVEPDIDLEVFVDAPSIDDGFEVLHEVAKLPGVVRCAFSNHLNSPDHGLYWRIVCDHEGIRWNIDNWLFARDHPGPVSARLVEPMLAALNPATRSAVLEIKEEAYARNEPLQGIWVYRAVLDDGVRGYPAFRDWLRGVDTDALTGWTPRPCGDGPPT
ncbi:hypothetical protein [Actinopolymorpha rutila]|uniref:Uncharacterized protein n=1 Tax=Actinopolymorpha rutila TaxID=446787 RepID=A0A852ZFX5_9ACTN|nr:hypothetical protein [Actinopolymorpha rutila]NYH92007.1 hypothetical protein [Actinopolymorpha rutila]